jgi:hypothetical protein
VPVSRVRRVLRCGRDVAVGPTRRSLLALVFCLTWSSFSEALDSRECSDLHLATQMTRADGKLQEAIVSADQCGSQTCPEPIRQECQLFRAELERAIPRLSLAVRDASGAVISKLHVELDGARVDSEKREFRLNPGLHRVHVSAAGFQAWEQEVELFQGESLPLEVMLLPLPTADNPRRTASWVFLGVGAASGIAAVILGVNARSLEGQLEECAPDCSEGAVNRVQTQYILTNVAWGVGLASGATGVALWWTSRESTPSSAVGLGISLAGADLNWRGEF